MATQLRLLNATLILTFLLIANITDVHAQSNPNGIIEIRSYNLKPGTREEFHKLMAEKCAPLLKKYEIDVVAFGPSIHDDNSYYLMRSFKNLDDHKKKEDAFYSSAEWEKGPQDAIMDCIKSYTTIVVPANAGMIKDIRASVGK